MSDEQLSDRCSHAGCAATAAIPDGGCLAHLSSEELKQELGRMARGARVEGNGVTFDEDLLGKVRDAVGGRFERADFAGAQFAENADFENVVVGDGTSFEGATFAARPSFAGATFGDDVSFRDTTFGPSADFRTAVFGDDACFIKAQLGEGARFDRARFGDRTSFVNTVWGARASFAEATFGRGTYADGTKFGDRPTFRGARFGNDVSLRKISFGAKVSFEAASFAGTTSFSASTFGNDANFSDTTFGDRISFRRTTFGRRAAFRRASFGDRAMFTSAEFGPGVAFVDATFRGRTRFNLTVFGDRVDFSGATFSGRLSFERAFVDGGALFQLANFERTRTFGPILVLGLISLDQASFLERVEMEVSAYRLIGSGLRLPEGGDLRVRWAEIVLDQASFGAPAVLVASSPFHTGAKEAELIRRFELADARPRLLAVRRANVSDLAVSGLDLSACRFAGAHNLDRLRVEADSSFARSPPGTSRRKVIAEEQEWRARRRRRRWPRWEAAALPFTTESTAKATILAPDAIAPIYRALRTAHESKGDAPGAADFYFGEMEMRRLDKTSPRAERATLWLYWVVSGYGLRSLRALASLLVTIVLFAFLFRQFGFDPPVGYTRALLFSAESTSSLFRVPETSNTTLTQTGEALQIALRLLGPLFFGLALLSLRGRVRR